MTNAEARFNKSLRPRKPEGSLAGTDSPRRGTSTLTGTAPELWFFPLLLQILLLFQILGHRCRIFQGRKTLHFNPRTTRPRRNLRTVHVPSFVVTLPSLQVSLQVRLQVSQSLSLQVFQSFVQLEFWFRPNLIHIQQVGLSVFYPPSFWTSVLLLFDCCSFCFAVLFDLAVRSAVADVSLFFTFA